MGTSSAPRRIASSEEFRPSAVWFAPLATSCRPVTSLGGRAPTGLLTSRPVEEGKAGASVSFTSPLLAIHFSLLAFPFQKARSRHPTQPLSELPVVDRIRCLNNPKSPAAGQPAWKLPIVPGATGRNTSLSGAAHVAFKRIKLPAAAISIFRGSIPHPMQLLCTLRNRCRERPRNTRYQADATPYLGRTCTGWIEGNEEPGRAVSHPSVRNDAAQS